VTSPQCCIPVEKRKSRPVSKKPTGTALSSRNESVSSLSSSREPPRKTKRLTLLHPATLLSQHRHDYSIRMRNPAEPREEVSVEQPAGIVTSSRVQQAKISVFPPLSLSAMLFSTHRDRRGVRERHAEDRPTIPLRRHQGVGRRTGAVLLRHPRIRKHSDGPDRLNRESMNPEEIGQERQDVPI
jgi:hypothetical protein